MHWKLRENTLAESRLLYCVQHQVDRLPSFDVPAAKGRWGTRAVAPGTTSNVRSPRKHNLHALQTQNEVHSYRSKTIASIRCLSE